MTESNKISAFKLLIILILGIGASLFVFGVLHPKSTVDGELVVDADIEAGGLVEIFANGNYEKSYQQPIHPGERFQYHFAHVPAEISHIRLDPTDKPDRRFTIYGITFYSHGRKVIEVGPAELGKWQFDGMARPQGSAASTLEFKTVTNDPMMWFFGLTWKGAEESGRSIDEYIYLAPWILLGAGLIWFFLAGGSKEVLLLGAVIAGAMNLVGPKWFQWISTVHTWAPVPIRNVLGISGYLGSSKVAEEAAAAGSLAAALLCGGLFGFFATRDEERKGHSLGAFSLSFYLGGIVLFALLTFPHFTEAKYQLATTHHDITNFDLNNVFTWQYAYEYGWLPFRDYWFPYGGYFNQFGRFRGDLIREYFWGLVLFSGLFVSVYELLNRKKGATAVILVALGYFVEYGYFLGTRRYLSGLSALLLFIIVRRRSNPALGLNLLVGLFIGGAFYLEPNQVLYAGAAAVPFWLAHFYRMCTHKKAIRELVNVAITGCGFLIVALSYVWWLDRNGQLEGFLEFYKYMGAMAANSSIPAPVAGWYQLSFDVAHVLFFMMHLVFAITTYQLVKDRFAPSSSGWVLSGIAGINGMVFLKMIFRPYMAEQVLIFGFFAILFFCVWWSEQWKNGQRFAASFLIGLILGWTIWNNTLPSMLHGHLLSLKQIPTDLKEVVFAGEDHETERDRFFARDRFTGVDQDLSSLINFLSEHSTDRRESFYVFGDNSYLYTILKQKPVKYITFYDGAHIWAQQDVVNQLEREKREYVIWDTSFKAFDGVPNVLRVPLLFSYVMNNYVPAKSFGTFEVLARKQEAVPIDISFWMTRLGNSLPLGKIAALSSAINLPECKVGDTCLPFLKLKPKRAEAQHNAVTCTVNGANLHLNFDTDGSEKVLNIPLGRIWLWSAATSMGATPELSWDTKRFDGAVVRKRVEPDLLY